VVEGGKQGGKGAVADQARHNAAADIQSAGAVEFQGQISGLVKRGRIYFCPPISPVNEEFTGTFRCND
jgi:hypothetical protein